MPPRLHPLPLRQVISKLPNSTGNRVTRSPERTCRIRRTFCPPSAIREGAELRLLKFTACSNRATQGESGSVPNANPNCQPAVTNATTGKFDPAHLGGGLASLAGLSRGGPALGRANERGRTPPAGCAILCGGGGIRVTCRVIANSERNYIFWAGCSRVPPCLTFSGRTPRRRRPPNRLVHFLVNYSWFLADPRLCWGIGIG